MTVRYADVIKYQFWGHEHQDYYYLTLDENRVPVGFSLVAPSMLADWRFASFRIYEYDRDTMDILNYVNYVADLNTIIRNDAIGYYEYYDFQRVYNVRAPTTNNMVNLFQKMYNNNQDNEYIQKYYQHQIPGFNTGTCDQTCRINILNNIINVQNN